MVLSDDGAELQEKGSGGDEGSEMKDECCSLCTGRNHLEGF